MAGQSFNIWDSFQQGAQVRAQQDQGRAMAEERQAHAEQRQAQTAKLQRDADRDAEGVAAFDEFFATYKPGQPMPTAAIGKMYRTIGPEKTTGILKGLMDLHQGPDLTNPKGTRDSMLTRLVAIKSSPAARQEAAYGAVTQDYVRRGLMTAEEIPPFSLEQLDTFEKELKGEPKLTERNPERDLVDPSGKVIVAGVPKVEPGSKPASVQEYEYALQHDGFKGSFADYQNADANRKQRAASERAPYFTYQPVFDPQGRPISAIRFDARGGPPVNVDVSALTGGGQLKPPPGTTGAQSIADEVSTVQLDRLKEMFDKGGKGFVGPVSARWETMKQTTPGFTPNETYANFKAATDAFKNSVIKAITGAAMSESEAKRIMGQIPDVMDKPNVWTAKANQTRKNLADLQAVLAKKSTAAPKLDGPADLVWDPATKTFKKAGG